MPYGSDIFSVVACGLVPHQPPRVHLIILALSAGACGGANRTGSWDW